MREPPRRGLVTKHLEVLGRRTDEADALGLARLREVGILGQETVAGVDRVDAALARDGQHALDVEVRTDGLSSARRPDQERLIRLEPMQREAVFVAVDRHGSQAELSGRSETPDRDLGTIGGEKFLHDE